jgi:F-box/leucine-rich repeat protein 2/20
MKRINDEVMSTLARAAPNLEVLDLSYVRELHNSALDAFVSCEEDEVDYETILLTPRDIGRDSGDSMRYRRRITRLRHLSVSACELLTDIACSNLAHTMPCLEYFEMAGIGADLKDEGLVRLLNTTPLIRRLDLEDACDIGDTVLAALTPTPVPDPRSKSTPEPGQALECLIISYASNVTDDALLGLIRGCPHLTALEVDNTRISAAVLKEFVRLSRKRRLVDARVVAIDCRSIGDTVVKDMTGITRPRKGWRSYEARKLGYLDSRDGEDLKVGQDECDEQRVVLKTFYSWQVVDAVRAARDKRHKSSPRRPANDSAGSASDSDDFFSTSGRARWWTPSGRRTSGNASPSRAFDNHDRESCRIM